MRRLACVVGVAVSVALLGCAMSGCGEKKMIGEKLGARPAERLSPPTLAAATTSPATTIAQKNCPVMGGPINKDIYVDHNGRRIYFCCPACVEAFKKDPEKYVAKVDEELKAGAAEKPAEKPAAE